MYEQNFRFLISGLGPKKVHWSFLAFSFLGSDLKRSTGPPRFFISGLGPKKVHWTFLVLYFYDIREELKFFWDVLFTIFFFQFFFGF